MRQCPRVSYQNGQWQCIITEKLAIMFLIFQIFLHFKIAIHISYKYKQIKVPNLVYFGSPSISSYNDCSTISINLQI